MVSNNRSYHFEAGFTIIEILVSIAVFSIAITALITGMLSNTSINTNIQQKAEASRITESTLESYRQVNNYLSLQSGSINPRIVNSSVTRNGITYNLKTTFCPTDLNADTLTAMPCSSSAVYIRVEVSNGDRILQKVETYYTKFGSAT